MEAIASKRGDLITKYCNTATVSAGGQAELGMVKNNCPINKLGSSDGEGLDSVPLRVLLSFMLNLTVISNLRFSIAYW